MAEQQLTNGKKYTLGADPHQPGTPLSSQQMWIKDENGNILLKSKFAETSTIKLLAEGMVLGGMIDLKLFDNSGNFVGSTKAEVAPKNLFQGAAMKSFSIYKEPEHKLVVGIHMPIGALYPKIIFLDESGKQLWYLQGSAVNLFTMTHKLYTLDDVLVGAFNFDLKTKAHTMQCNDPKFTPFLIFGTWVILQSDSSKMLV
ncbi:MAG: hypothetical protein ACHQX1_03530 [Candidatus Micrarchaeales archaeon]